MRECRICASEYRGDPRSRYCSTDCRAEAARQRARDWYAEHRDDESLRQRVRVSTRRHYEKVIADPTLNAARLAATAAWRADNPDRMRESNREWCDANRDKKRAKDHRRRARLMAAFIEDVDPSVIWERDHGICGICSDAIDPDLRWPHKRTRTIDHIVPLARGGTHSYANVQLAHMDCNARKNDRIA